MRGFRSGYCIFPNVPTWPQNAEVIWVIILLKKRSVSKPVVAFKCKLCYQEFPGFYALRQNKDTQHANVDPDDIIIKILEAILKEELRWCRHFFVDSELERARHKIFTYAIKNLGAKNLDEKLDPIFNNLKFAAKVILALEQT